VARAGQQGGQGTGNLSQSPPLPDPARPAPGAPSHPALPSWTAPRNAERSPQVAVGLVPAPGGPSRGVADEVFTPPNVTRLDHEPSVNLDPAMGGDPPPMPGGCTLCAGQTPLVGITESSWAWRRWGVEGKVGASRGHSVARRYAKATPLSAARGAHAGTTGTNLGRYGLVADHEEDVACLSRGPSPALENPCVTTRGSPPALCAPSLR
jgi:hypothetical protein